MAKWNQKLNGRVNTFTLCPHFFVLLTLTAGNFGTTGSSNMLCTSFERSDQWLKPCPCIKTESELESESESENLKACHAQIGTVWNNLTLGYQCLEYIQHFLLKNLGRRVLPSPLNSLTPTPTPTPTPFWYMDMAHDFHCTAVSTLSSRVKGPRFKPRRRLWNFFKISKIFSIHSIFSLLFHVHTKIDLFHIVFLRLLK